MSDASYTFSFGPWNIHEGSDPFGPEVRPSISFADKLTRYKELGFDGVQFHDDDAVPDIINKSASELSKEAAEMKKVLDDAGLVAEFTAPRLWESADGIDGSYTSNDPEIRKRAIERSKRSVDVAKELGCNMQVLWWAREGTYIRESKDAVAAYGYLVEAVDAILDHDSTIEIAIEPKPNEPMDHAYAPTIGHALAIAYRTKDPSRVGGLIESAHAILAGSDPSDEMAFALAENKLFSVHLNDQNGLKFDQDKTFGSVNLRMAFNQVRVLESADYASTGRMVGLDVKAMRTQKAEVASMHLTNSRKVFLALVDKVRSFDTKREAEYIAKRNYEALEIMVLDHLMGL
ncbi:MAG TPA: xylose isomerase [Candidatus Hydrogenedentes bacterium]|nr:xylose isomerase [Candidatus Hydrogenedentota bacterium]